VGGRGGVCRDIGHRKKKEGMCAGLPSSNMHSSSFSVHLGKNSNPRRTFNPIWFPLKVIFLTHPALSAVMSGSLFSVSASPLMAAFSSLSAHSDAFQFLFLTVWLKCFCGQGRRVSGRSEGAGCFGARVELI
jgi:hypothetical protein